MAKMGRPLAYAELEPFKKKVDEFFELCDKTERPYTISGLCLHLDITRETLCNYEKKEKFFDTIKKAKLRVENYVEENSIQGKLNPTMSIFNLKNNFGWKDRLETDTDKEVLNKLDELLDKQSAEEN